MEAARNCWRGWDLYPRLCLMPHKIGHAQQIVQNYFATLMMQSVTLNFGAELLCSVFNALWFFFLLQTTSTTTTFYVHYYDEQEKNKMRGI